MEKYSTYSVEQFASDSHFIRWVISPDNNSGKFWLDVINRFPEQKEKIDEAASLIKSIQVLESPVSQERLDKIWQKVAPELQKKKQFNLNVYLRWAAIFILFVSISLLVPRFLRTPKFEFNKAEFAMSDEAQIIMSDGSRKSIINKDSEIQIKSSGQIIVDCDTLKSIPTPKKAQLNHVIMPYGQQSSVQLPDGTKVFINAGSKISFPSVFSDSKREVFLVGEAYFEVESDKKKPFIVHTADMDITVTGTAFNVSAYAEDVFTEAVLVSGVVNVSKQSLLSKKIKIEPGESARLNKILSSITKSKVDTERYTSWKNGYIICENDFVTDIVKKIERFYAQKITIDEDVNNITFSGKLDLSDNVLNVLESMVFASALKLEINEKQIIIRK